MIEAAQHIYHSSSFFLPSGGPPSYLEKGNDFRLVVLGGSTSEGSPYRGAQKNIKTADPDFEVPEHTLFNLLRLVHYWLMTRYGHTDVVATNVTHGGWAAEFAIDKYRETSQPKPDVIVLYSGHNEWQCYYSLNMMPPPRMLDWLGKLKTGSFLLRSKFMRGGTADDKKYRGEFFSRHEVPPYEVAFNKLRYQRYVEGLIRHCQDEDIFLIIVIPESNYVIPPVRSIYRGPRSRMAEAERMFKRAMHKKYFEQDAEAARQMLEEIRSFCSFAKLHFELGDIYYARQQLQAARDALRRAMDEDGMPDGIKSDYKAVLKRLAEKHSVPVIRMYDVITEDMGITIPDNSCFIDQCHLTLPAYKALSRRIMQLLQQHDVIKAPPGADKLEISPSEYARNLFLPQGVIDTALLASVSWIVTIEVPAHFSKTRWTRLITARRHLDGIEGVSSSEYWSRFKSELDEKMSAEKENFRGWVLSDEEDESR